MGVEQFASRCWGVDPAFTVSFTDDERREIEVIAGVDLAPRVLEELRALAFHVQARRSMTTESDDIVYFRDRFARVAKAARKLREELVDEYGGFDDAALVLLGFGRSLVEDDEVGDVSIFVEEQAKREFDSLISTIKRIEHGSSITAVSYGLTMRGHNASDRLKEYVVDGVIEIYRVLLAREIPPGGGNPSGPAARFLFAAANPLLRPVERGLSTLGAARQQLARRRDVHK